MMSATTGRPTSIVLSDRPDLSLSGWVCGDDGHLVVLMLAWAYALSARWTEIIHRASPVEYTASKASWEAPTASSEGASDGGYMVVEVGEVTGEAARWWAAVLAPGEGWKAAIPHERWRLLSPWSVTKDLSEARIALSGSPSRVSSHPPTPASFETALKYIEDYATLHNADRASRAALAAALLLPLAKLDNRKITLHARWRLPRNRKARRNTDLHSSKNAADSSSTGS